MARYIDADELLRRLEAIRDDWLNDGEPATAAGVGGAIIELKDMLNAQESVVAVLPQDYHDRCMELEISRRFAAEQKVRAYPYALDAIRNDLTNAIGLVERLQGLANDKSDE